MVSNHSLLKNFMIPGVLYKDNRIKYKMGGGASKGASSRILLGEILPDAYISQYTRSRRKVIKKNEKDNKNNKNKRKKVKLLKNIKTTPNTRKQRKQRKQRGMRRTRKKKTQKKDKKNPLVPKKKTRKNKISHKKIKIKLKV